MREQTECTNQRSNGKAAVWSEKLAQLNATAVNRFKKILLSMRRNRACSISSKSCCKGIRHDYFTRGHVKVSTDSRLDLVWYKISAVLGHEPVQDFPLCKLRKDRALNCEKNGASCRDKTLVECCRTLPKHLSCNLDSSPNRGFPSQTPRIIVNGRQLLSLCGQNSSNAHHKSCSTPKRGLALQRPSERQR